MQISHYKPRYIEKEINTEEGAFLARFVVVSEGNSFKLKLVEMIPFEPKSTIPNKVFLIVAPKIKQVVSYTVKVSTKIISPFSNFDFFVSQPTRAPSF